MKVDPYKKQLVREAILVRGRLDAREGLVSILDWYGKAKHAAKS